MQSSLQGHVVQRWVKALPNVSEKFDFMSKSFKRKFSLNLFACSLMIQLDVKRIGKIFLKKPLSRVIKKPELKFNHG